ncbi:VOC family protein [Paracoccus marinaquae]|uniref:VOC family protein n=1 Tax=Paracoccus marinaquae TaxID=2841926 RepID=A0ABS6AD37_9RHOB|nr:VOC family protein [Paracoccus marinaquae]MBU3028513.1 VOC family protein [Paracoccus marinaquae]
MQPMIYLFFKGNCLEAMTHYADTLGGQIDGVFRNGDAAPEDRMPGGDEMVMNMSMRLGDTSIMASDNSDDMYDKPQGFYVVIDPTSLAEFERIFAALSKDAEAITMPPAETFWAERFSMFRDRFGTPWMLSFGGSKAPGQ